MRNADNKRARAAPTKRFFVEMITRDITLEDSILDLIDNSIDSAWKLSGSHQLTLEDSTDLSKFEISVSVSENLFRIHDNCGGMTLNDAIDHAFNFGRPNSIDSEDYTIGVYGIGMKRAIFKIGRKILIRSTFNEKNGSILSFSVPINVREWIEEDKPPWDFDIAESEHLRDEGVDIEVQDLTAAASDSFGNQAFVERLKQTIARDYALHLERGLRIRVNGKNIDGVQLEFLSSDDFVPMRYSYEESDPPVKVEIIGGMAAKPTEGTEPDDLNRREYNRFGWYVACNGRIVLAADKSSVAGWGLDNWPNWHPQYAGFLGIVLFSASDANHLPLTTTKRSVDVTSEVFLRARPHMRKLTKEWTSYTNLRKQAIEEAKMKEQLASAVQIRNVIHRNDVLLPQISSNTPKQSLANVHYSVATVRMKALAKALGKSTMTYRDVGIKSFEYTYDDFVGDE